LQVRFARWRTVRCWWWISES